MSVAGSFLGSVGRALTARRIGSTFGRMSWGTNPSVSGEAIRKALGPDDPSVKSEGQTALDEADLRELERAEYYGETPAVPEVAVIAHPKRRTILDRLFRR
jgi:hypothetical protein